MAANDKATPADKAPAKKRVYAVNGDMIHLFTNVRFTKDSKPVEVDNWIEVQVEAGKLAYDET